MKKHIVIGTRGSKLSLIQTELVKKRLKRFLPDYTITIQIITTHGDKTMKPIPLDTVGKGWFTKELDDAVRDGSVDIAIHSLKDIPDDFPSDLTIVAIPDREDAREALITKSGLPLAKLPVGAVIGTDSIRRKVQILSQRPDVTVKSIRGNVPTRVEKLDHGEYDAICLAVAGLKRLGMEKRIIEYFDEKDFIPSPGQGAIAIVSRKTERKLNQLLTSLTYKKAELTTKTERIFSTTMGGGCSLPVGGYAKINGEKLTLYGMIGSLDARHILKQTISGEKKSYSLLAKKLARIMLRKAASWYRPVSVVITRPIIKRDPFVRKIKQLGCRIIAAPSIATIDNTRGFMVQKVIKKIASYDWIIFTSKNGVTFFMQALLKAGQMDKIQLKQIGVVGTQTARELKNYHIPFSFIPSQFTTADVAREMPDITNKKILLPRSDIANPQLPKDLKKKGAKVVDFPVYTTISASFDRKPLEKLLQKKHVVLLIFTSPSTIKGFLKNIKESPFKKDIFLLPAFSIGSVTTKAAQKYGFTNIITADTFTTEGIVEEIQQFLLYRNDLS